MSLLSELHRRKVLQTGAGYVVGSLAAWGAFDFVADAFLLPPSILRYTVAASIVGLPVALIAAWVLEVRLAKASLASSTSTPKVVLVAPCSGLERAQRDSASQESRDQRNGE